MRKLYTYLYYLGPKDVIFNYTNYLINNVYALFHSALCYYIPLYVFQQSNILLPDGKNTDRWSMSFTMFTCLFTVVTIRIFNWTRWWTCFNFVFYTIFSIFVYIAYVWAAESMELTKEIFFVAQTNKSPLFWLTLFFLGGTFYCIDVAINTIKYTDFKDASDKVRDMIMTKRS